MSAKWKKHETIIKHRDNDPTRKKALEEIAELEAQWYLTGSLELVEKITLSYEQLHVYDEMMG